MLISCNNTDIDRLQIIQNRAMRIILKCDRDASRIWMMEQLNWMSIAQKIKYNILIMIYKIRNGLAPEYLRDFIIETGQVHGRETRNNRELRLPKYKTEKRKKSIFYEGIKMFNELPKETKQATNLCKFKRLCKDFIKSRVDPFKFR